MEYYLLITLLSCRFIIFSYQLLIISFSDHPSIFKRVSKVPHEYSQQQSRIATHYEQSYITPHKIGVKYFFSRHQKKRKFSCDDETMKYFLNDEMIVYFCYVVKGFVDENEIARSLFQWRLYFLIFDNLFATLSKVISFDCIKNDFD